MLVQQASEAAVAGLSDQSEIIGCGAAPPGARGGDELGKDIRPAPLDLQADIEGEPIAVTVEGYCLRRHPLRQAYCGGHGPRQALLRLAVEPQRQRAAIALARAHLGVAGVPDRLAVGRGGIAWLEQQAI